MSSWTVRLDFLLASPDVTPNLRDPKTDEETA
jgi:hypothetical protein